MTTYSRKMQAIFHRAQLEAERFGSSFLGDLACASGYG